MGAASSKEQLIVAAIENQDTSELRTILKDLVPEQIRTICKSFVPGDENQCTILHYAAWQDNPDLLAPFLDYADDLEVRDGLGWTPLMTAVNRGSKQNVKLLLARGAKVDCDWTKGMSLIADAMNFNDAELVTILMEHGAQVVPAPDMLDSGQDQSAFYLLHYAVDDGLFEIATLLIEKGKVPLDMLDQAGWSPLHLASGHNNNDMVQLLLEKGADVNVKDSNGNTPLAWAKEMNATDVIRELERKGGVADNEWHGDKLEMKTNEERAEEAWEAEGEEEEVDESADKPATNGIETARFEIEIEDPKAKNRKDANVLDALQRQTSNGRPVL